MYYVYILQSLKDKKTYTGYTNNPRKRLKQHNSGQVISTKHRKPFKIILIEDFKSEKEAEKREKYWKSGAGRRKLKQFFKNI